MGSSLVVQWLRLPTTTAEGTGLILCQGTKNPRGMWHGQKEKEIGEKERKGRQRVGVFVGLKVGFIISSYII